MAWFKKTLNKAEQAEVHASSAISGFETAKALLAKAIDLLKQDVEEHRAAATSHTDAADAASAEAERHGRIHARLTDLLS